MMAAMQTASTLAIGLVLSGCLVELAARINPRRLHLYMALKGIILMALSFCLWSILSGASRIWIMLLPIGMFGIGATYCFRAWHHRKLVLGIGEPS
jgi:hypothetical protein